VNYVRNAWYVACWMHDVKPGGLLGMRILDEPIVLWRGRDGVLTVLGPMRSSIGGAFAGPLRG
jgi:phenylpropionate dioxygenase-like ring-hydroxylating dioxygenase large terminal subunit